MSRRTLAELEALMDDHTWERFWSFVDLSGDCWIWTGQMSGGYGHFKIRNSRTERPHRLLYRLLVNDIDENTTLDHVCHTTSDCVGGDDCPHRACLNPDHLEPVTMRANVLRSANAVTAINARKTHCPKGHPYAGSNLRISGHSRQCRTCKRERDLARYHARKEAS